MNKHLNDRKAARARGLGASALACALFMTLLAGCAQPGGSGPTGPTLGVFTSGYYNNGSMDLPCYWKGTTRVDLPIDPAVAPFGGHANAIAVSGGTVYTAGYQEGGDEAACYWAGTTRIDMGGSKANAIRVVDGTVYTAIEGDWYTPSFYYGAKYGTGTTLTALPGIDPPAGSTNLYAGDFFAYGIDVAGGIVYTSGYCRDGTGGFVACYWTGTTRTDIPEGDSTTAISVSGGQVYTSGSYWSGTTEIPCYWTGTVVTDLPSGGAHNGIAQAIEVAGGTVYTAGYCTNGSRDIPCYWTGTVRTDLPDDGTHGARAQGIAVLGGVVYTAGYYNDGSNDIPCYWKGATRVELPRDGINNAYATGIVVVEE